MTDPVIAGLVVWSEKPEPVLEREVLPPSSHLTGRGAIVALVLALALCRFLYSQAEHEPLTDCARATTALEFERCMARPLPREVPR